MIYNKYILYISTFIPSMRYMKKYIVISIVILLFTIGKVFETSAHYTVPHPKYVALTFDDGPDQTTTPLLLDILKANNVSINGEGFTVSGSSSWFNYGIFAENKINITLYNLNSFLLLVLYEYYLSHVAQV